MAVRAHLLLTLLIATLLGAASPAHAQREDLLAVATAALALLPSSPDRIALAAEATGEGHWTFVSTTGERFTAANAEEMKRVLPTLAPEAAKPGKRLGLVVTETTAFRQRGHLLALALARLAGTDLMVVIGREIYPLVRRGERANERLYGQVLPTTLIELTERRHFDEAIWQLAHSLRRTSVRVLALEPGGPEAVTAAPRLDPQSRRPLTDQIAPGALSAALRTLAGQTVILTARRDGERLAFRPSSGPELHLPLKEIWSVAEAADVNLVLLHSANPRQPGSQSWWWWRITVGRLDGALKRDRLADFLAAIVAPESKLMVSVEDLGTGRIRLKAEPLRDESRPRTGIGEALSEFASNIVGQVVVSGVDASFRDRARQGELDRRLIAAVPSLVQWIYLGLVAVGVLGHGVARAWWSRIWPPEMRGGYRNAFGYVAARGVRAAAYVAMFMPLVALASAPVALVRSVVGRKRESGAVSASEPTAKT
jgi:hypothetical protein